MSRKRSTHGVIGGNIKRRFGLPVGLMALAVLAVIGSFIGVMLPSRSIQAAPYLGCSVSGYIFKYQGSPDTNVQGVDMVTGQGVTAGTITGHNFNAVGFNPKDNYFYGWDLSGSGTLMRVESDNPSSPPEPLTIGNSYPGPTTNIFSGDVDEDGFYWFFTVSGANTTWYQIDLNTPTPMYVDSGTVANPAGSEGTDWAYVPGTDNLYRGMDSGTNVHIVAFNRTSKTFLPSVGTVTNITAAADRNMGAVYADPNGNFYMSSHQSGKLWRVDLGDAPTFTAVELGASDTESNDGARCALASVPVDLGDAPDSYATLIGSDGPRHSITSFDVNASIAPLMLGTHIDIEADGFPGVQARGDDGNHDGAVGSSYVDDERGVTNVVVAPGAPTALDIPVKVTNTSVSAATLAGWIDLNNNGTFETGERVTTTIPASSGTASYELTFPSTTFTANTYARFRVFSGIVANPLPTGPVAGGEVEDVLVQVGSYDTNKTANPTEGSLVSPGQVVTYTVSVQNTGATALVNLKFDDDLSNVLDDATLEGSPAVTPSTAGSASVTGTMLEFAGDVGAGQTVAVTYNVKIKALGALGNSALLNTITAAHSASCHPDVVNNAPAVSDPDCQTNHPVNTTPLPGTGSDIMLPIVISTSLVIFAGIGWVVSRRLTVFSRK